MGKPWVTPSLTWQDERLRRYQSGATILFAQRYAQKGTGLTGTSAPAAAPTPSASSCRGQACNLCG